MRSWEKSKMSPKGKAIDLNWNLLLNWKSSRLALSHTPAVSTNYYQEYFLKCGNLTSPSKAFRWFLCFRQQQKKSILHTSTERKQHHFGLWKSPCAHSVTLNCKRKDQMEGLSPVLPSLWSWIAALWDFVEVIRLLHLPNSQTFDHRPLGLKALLLLVRVLGSICCLWGDLTAPQSQPVYHNEVGPFLLGGSPGPFQEGLRNVCHADMVRVNAKMFFYCMWQLCYL